MKWPNAVSLSRPQRAEIGRKLREAGYDIKTKDLDAYAVNIVSHAAGAVPDAAEEIE